MMVRKENIIKVGLFDESLQFWQERELQMRLCQIGDVGIVRENLTLYRILSEDKNRKTNQYDGWVKTVNYVRNKHKDLIGNLTEDMLCKMESLIRDEGKYQPI